MAIFLRGAITARRRAHEIERYVGHPVRVRDRAVGDVPAVGVDPLSTARRSCASGAHEPVVGDPLGVADGRVGERPRARLRDGARHVGHAVVDDAVHLVRRVVVVGRAAGLDAAALVDRDVDDDAALAPSAAISSSVTSLGATAPVTSTAPTTRSARRTVSSMLSGWSRASRRRRRRRPRGSSSSRRARRAR